VPGSFQEVGDEYWAMLLPPVKPAGTTFVDFRITLDGAISDRRPTRCSTSRRATATSPSASTPAVR
jgi:hypothetical protein